MNTSTFIENELNRLAAEKDLKAAEERLLNMTCHREKSTKQYAQYIQGIGWVTRRIYKD